MKTRTAWILGIGLLVLVLAIPLISMASRLLGYRSYYWGSGMMGGVGMMGHSFNFLNPMGWLGMFWMWLVPLGLALLVIVGLAALLPQRPAAVQTVETAAISAPAPAASQRACQNCGKAAQPDWNTCPYCGQPLN